MGLRISQQAAADRASPLVYGGLCKFLRVLQTRLENRAPMVNQAVNTGSACGRPGRPPVKIMTIPVSDKPKLCEWGRPAGSSSVHLRPSVFSCTVSLAELREEMRVHGGP